MMSSTGLTIYLLFLWIVSLIVIVVCKAIYKKEDLEYIFGYYAASIIFVFTSLLLLAALSIPYLEPIAKWILTRS